MLSLKVRFLLPFLFGLAALAAPAAAKELPPRPAGAMSGSAFVAKIRNLSGDAREAAILAEVRKGNVPTFLRRLTPVTTTLRVDGRPKKVTFLAMPDYLAVGSDKDFVHIPMNPITAQKIADEFGYSLPTPKMVDEINRSAKLKLAPRPLPPSRRMVTTEYYWKHQQMIESQRKGRSTGSLTSGHKKDIVVTNRLASRPRQVAIYGWHRPNGRPIQPLSLVHDNKYADYSHGVRLVSKKVYVDGKADTLANVMKSPRLAKSISYEGPMRTLSAAPAKSGGATYKIASKTKKMPKKKLTGRKGRMQKRRA